MVNVVESPLFILLVAVTVVVLPLAWLVRRRRARRLKERELAELYERPYTGPTSFSLRFASTHQDLLDAYAAQQFRESGWSSLERALVVGLGIFWVGCAVIFGPRAIKEGRWWHPLIPFAFGTSVIWRYVAKPFLTRRHIRQTNPATQPLAVDFTASGVHIEASGMGALDRTWDELVAAELEDKGVALVFTDGICNWLPNRAFQGEDERRMCAAYLMGKLPQEREVLDAD